MIEPIGSERAGQNVDSNEHMSTLAEQLEQIPFFPPAVQVIPRLLPLFGNDKSPTDELAEVVRVDSGLTADILRVCNSAAFGFQMRAQTIQDAALRLGMKEMYKITSKVIAEPILGAGVHQVPVDGVDLWHHSLATGSASAIIAEAMGTDMEIGFTIGLLHDIGKVRLVQTVGSDYREMIIAARGGAEPLHSMEAQKWGLDHAVIGGQLLKRWNFPENMRDAVLLHHSVMGTTPNLDFAAQVNLADYLAGAIGLPYDRLGPVHPPNPRALHLANMSVEDLHKLAPKVIEHFNREQAPFVERG
jgi:putative nucleotidyltransferase with HDIG domain